MTIGHVLLFFLFQHHGDCFCYALIHWIVPVGHQRDPNTGLWIVKPEYLMGKSVSVKIHPFTCTLARLRADALVHKPEQVTQVPQVHHQTCQIADALWVVASGLLGLLPNASAKCGVFGWSGQMPIDACRAIEAIDAHRFLFSIQIAVVA